VQGLLYSFLCFFLLLFLLVFHSWLSAQGTCSKLYWTWISGGLSSARVPASFNVSPLFRRY
jgi:hypothetical protein